ncbi:MAG: hypothetical protein WCJ56_00890 [bacterium]
MQVAEETARSAPQALFTTLVNPTDVLARAIALRTGLTAAGICVEVPQLRRWLALQLGGYARDVQVEYLGVNHVGWVSGWTYRGEDGNPLLRAALPTLMQQAEWNPMNDWFAELFLATGDLRTSPYHCWPYAHSDTTRAQERSHAYKAFNAARIPAPFPFPWQDDLLAQALAEDRMVPEYEDAPLQHIRMPYQYSDTRHTLGALALGLAGVATGPVPLQVRNGDSNPLLPADAWIEVPTCYEGGHLQPQNVGPISDWATAQLRQIVAQRMALSDWFVQGDPVDVSRAFLFWPDEVSMVGSEMADTGAFGNLMQASDGLPAEWY